MADIMSKREFLALLTAFIGGLAWWVNDEDEPMPVAAPIGPDGEMDADAPDTTMFNGFETYATADDESDLENLEIDRAPALVLIKSGPQKGLKIYGEGEI